MPRHKLRTPDLEARLLDAALGILEAEDTALTARSVAAAADTSTAALYELFGDKGGLIRAVFFEGFRLLRTGLAGVEATDDPRADVRALLDATRAFAIARPMLFEVMFARPFSEFRPEPDDQAAAVAIHRTVMRFVDRARAAGVLAGNRTDVALALVTTNNGLIAAELAGLLGSTPSTARRRRSVTLDALTNGLASGSRDESCAN